MRNSKKKKEWEIQIVVEIVHIPFPSNWTMYTSVQNKASIVLHTQRNACSKRIFKSRKFTQDVIILTMVLHSFVYHWIRLLLKHFESALVQNLRCGVSSKILWKQTFSYFWWRKGAKIEISGNFCAHSTVWFLSLSYFKTKQRKQIFFKAAKHCQFGHFSQLYERKQSLESDCAFQLYCLEPLSKAQGSTTAVYI